MGFLELRMRRHYLIWWHWSLWWREDSELFYLASGACLRKKNARAAARIWENIWLRRWGASLWDTPSHTER